MSTPTAAPDRRVDPSLAHDDHRHTSTALIHRIASPLVMPGHLFGKLDIRC